MINALYSSQEGGARSFQDGDGIEFGWKAIVDMFSRECQRRDKGHARMVPKLREIHVLRDSWTKLNVFPAKIMQVCPCNSKHCNNCCFVTIARASSDRVKFLRDANSST